ncbi:MAG TPA: hypothetical protein PLD88_02895 [Candidatus Berkiella sp.]|nr:hypothetical protein [Candidatus Berkiella sp.]
MMRIYSKMKYSLWLLLLLPFSLYAGGEHASIGEAAENLMAPVSFMTKLALLACFIIGVALLLGALAQYKIHRQSPKLVPLTTPITLFVLGLISIGIPFATNMFGESFSSEQQSSSTTRSSGLPLPDLNSNKGSKLPNAPKKQVELPPAEPVQEPPPSSGGRWTDDPQYNR